MIVLKGREEIEKIRTASKYAMEMLLYLGEFIREGVKTIELERLCEERMRSLKVIEPAFKGYNGYPFCLCVSVNEEVIHGMPGDYVLREGDIVSLDFGAVYDGYYGDVAVTFPVGRITEEKARLLKVTEQALREGIEAAVEGGRLFDISYSIQSCVEGAGYSVIREFVGHGIGRELHEEPQVPNYGKKGTGPRLKRGMVMAIEPMVSMGKSDIIIRENGWTAAVRDGSVSAHFEHTIAITDRGTEVLSQV